MGAAFMRRTTTIVAAWVTVLLLIGAALLGVASLLTLSGCLTAGKIRTWESALLGWARKGGPECVEAVKPASKYLTNANRTLQGAGEAGDVQSDQEAKKRMQDAAEKCGEVVP